MLVLFLFEGCERETSENGISVVKYLVDRNCKDRPLNLIRQLRSDKRRQRSLRGYGRPIAARGAGEEVRWPLERVYAFKSLDNAVDRKRTISCSIAGVEPQGRKLLLN